MSLREEHIKLIEAVNNATTRAEHDAHQLRLDWWRTGVADAGAVMDYMAGDRHYLDQDIDRPMCCGVWLDWEPS